MSRSSWLVEVQFSEVEGFPGLSWAACPDKPGLVPPPTPPDQGKRPGQRGFRRRPSGLNRPLVIGLSSTPPAMSHLAGSLTGVITLLEANVASNGYPKLTSKAWAALRTRAAAAPTTKFTPATVAALMNMSSPKSAADNTVYPMRRLGLIDEEGGLTPRGNKWRVDGTFADACQEILDDVYPEDLAALTNGDGLPDPQQVRTWFDHKGFGDSNARQMAATYVMVAGKQIPDVVATDAKKAAPKVKQVPQKGTSGKAPEKAASEGEAGPDNAPRREQEAGPGPNVHLDIQIHIPADASVDQIDQIFESMARHLYQR